MYYILVDKKPVATKDIYEFGKFFENDDNKNIATTEFLNIRITTIFLGTEYGFEQGKPILFETMVFGGEDDFFSKRYTSWDEAIEGHEKVVEMVKAKLQ